MASATRITSDSIREERDALLRYVEDLALHGVTLTELIEHAEDSGNDGLAAALVALLPVAPIAVVSCDEPVPF